MATPTLILKPRRGWQALNLGEVWKSRDLILTLAGRDIKLRYRQTALGIAWVVLQPLIAAAIFAFVFGRVARMAAPGVSYFLFAFAGMLGWNAFYTTLTRAGMCIVQNANLVAKVYFPRLVLPLSTVFAALIDFGVAFVLLLVMMLAQGVLPGIRLLTFPLWLALLLLLALGLGLYAAAWMAKYRDVQYVLPVVTQLLLYASPVGYAVSAVPANLRQLYLLNPLAGLLDALRWSVLGIGAPHWPAVCYSGVVAFLIFLAGMFAFRRLERNLADVL